MKPWQSEELISSASVGVASSGGDQNTVSRKDWLSSGTRPGDQGLEPAYTRAFDTLTKILERAGVSWADVVEVRSFHTDPNAQIDAMAAVKRRYRAAPDPAWTAVGTSGLLASSGITEIALVAYKPKAKAK